jgi:hypothetical protein
MDRYEQGKIYKLQFPDKSFYIGSTCLELSKRLYYHKCKRPYKSADTHPMYLKWREIGRNDVEIVLIEDYPCKSKNELESKENEHILLHIDNPLCMNRKRAIADPDYNKKYEKSHPGRKDEYRRRPEVREREREKQRERMADPAYRARVNELRRLRREKKKSDK